MSKNMWAVVRKADGRCVAVASSGLAGHELKNAFNDEAAEESGEWAEPFECRPVGVGEVVFL